MLISVSFSLRALRRSACPSLASLDQVRWWFELQSSCTHGHVTCCLLCLFKALVQLINEPVGKCFICFLHLIKLRMASSLITMFDWEALSVGRGGDASVPLLFVHLSAGKLDEVKIIWLIRPVKNPDNPGFFLQSDLVSRCNFRFVFCFSVCFLWFPPSGRTDQSQCEWRLCSWVNTVWEQD